MTQIPGFIDLQVNGCKCVDFSDKTLTAETCADACQNLLSCGTAAFLATVITSDTMTYRQNLAILAEIIEDRAFKGKVLGIHAEGPFISKKPGAVGAHNPAWVKRPSLKFFEKMQKWAKGRIKMITLAAETQGAAELTRHLVKQGIVVSLGHQMAGYEDMARLADAGAQSITHLGNAMPNQVHRHHNTLLAGLAEERLTALIVADGHHLPVFVIQSTLHAKGLDNTIVTSDASPIAGCKPGAYQVLGNRAILRRDGLLYNPDKKCMVGSSFTMLECMNWLLRRKLLSPAELMQVGFTNPLRLIRVRSPAIKSQRQIKYDKQNNQFIISQ